MVNENGIVESWSAGEPLRPPLPRCIGSTPITPQLQPSNPPPPLGLGLLEYILPDFSTALRKIKKARIPAYSRIFQPFTPGGGGYQMSDFIQHYVTSRRLVSE